MISGETLVSVLIYLVVWGLVLYVLWWGLGKINPPEPFMKVGTVVLVILTVIVLLNLLFGFVGQPLIRWK
jgi:uncharacterized membrane protein YwzB